MAAPLKTRLNWLYLTATENEVYTVRRVCPEPTTDTLFGCPRCAGVIRPSSLAVTWFYIRRQGTKFANRTLQAIHKRCIPYDGSVEGRGIPSQRNRRTLVAT